MPPDPLDLPDSYTRVAPEYARRIYAELKDKPFDRAILERFAQAIHGSGPVCDLGCGPGQVARFLRDCGADAFGIDVAPGMVEVARQLNPDIEFRQGDMLALDLPGGSLGGIAAFYSIIHVPREKIAAALQELKRVLRPGGLLLVAFHIGEETVHLDEWWGEPVCLDFHFFTREEMERYLRSAGFLIEESLERPPYPEVEHQSRRAYLLARKDLDRPGIS